jgi:hypothetical protein
MWAAFFLQEHELVIPIPLGYLQNPAVQASTRVPEQGKVTFVLTDEKRPGAIWHNEIFSLLNLTEPVQLLAIDAPNAVEIVEGDQFVWLDNRFVNLTIYSNATRQASLVIPECWQGPSRPSDTNRALIVDVNGNRTEVPTSQNLKIPLSLRKGNNLVRLSCKELPMVNETTSGDTRARLLGIKGLKVTAAD